MVRTWRIFVGAIGALVCSLPHGARASATDTASIACGSVSGSWNAPNGALVLSRSHGIIDAVLNAVGEYYTHSMLSHGPGGFVSHSTMYTPGTSGWPTYCSTPLEAEELRNGYPGPSQVTEGAIYDFLYLNGDGVESVVYQVSSSVQGLDDRGASIADYLWFEQPGSAVGSRQDGEQQLYRLRHHETEQFFNYVLYQYRDQENINLGEPAWNNGTVCSTFLAYAHYMAGRGVVEPKTYSHEQIVAGAGALYATVEDKCNTETSWIKDVAAKVTCFEDICDDAARQARNCMARGICDSDDAGLWNVVKNDPGAVAISTSPDLLGGFGGNPKDGAGASVWADDPGSELQWNSGGEIYGCWF